MNQAIHPIRRDQRQQWRYHTGCIAKVLQIVSLKPVRILAWQVSLISWCLLKKRSLVCSNGVELHISRNSFNRGLETLTAQSCTFRNIVGKVCLLLTWNITNPVLWRGKHRKVINPSADVLNLIDSYRNMSYFIWNIPSVNDSCKKSNLHDPVLH